MPLAFCPALALNDLCASVAGGGGMTVSMGLPGQAFGEPSSSSFLAAESRLAEVAADPANFLLDASCTSAVVGRLLRACLIRFCARFRSGHVR